MAYKQKFIGIYIFLFTVKCPIGTYYDVSISNCTNCPIGYFSTVEGALQCQPCPGNTSTLEEGSKTCTGNYVFSLFSTNFVKRWSSTLISED